MNLLGIVMAIVFSTRPLQGFCLINQSTHSYIRLYSFYSLARPTPTLDGRITYM